jgi:hypothetical protein
LNIFQKLQTVMKSVAYVKKDTTIKEGGNYSAVSHDNVTAHVRPLFLEHGIVLHPTLIEGLTLDSGKKTSRETPILRYIGTYDVAFVNVEDPTDRVVVHIQAHAEDTGDKAPGKAISYACKYAILKVLMIETGENDESRVRSSGMADEDFETHLSAIQTAATIDDARKAKDAAFAAAKEAKDLDAHRQFKDAVLKRLRELDPKAKAA